MKIRIKTTLLLTFSLTVTALPQTKFSFGFGYNKNLYSSHFERQLIYWELTSIYNLRAGYYLNDHLQLTINFAYAELPFKNTSEDLIVPAYVGAPIPYKNGESADIISSGIGLKYYYTANNIFSQFFNFETGLLFINEGEVFVNSYNIDNQLVAGRFIEGTGEFYNLPYAMIGAGLSFNVGGFLLIEAGASVLLDFEGELFSIPVGISVGTELQ